VPTTVPFAPRSNNHNASVISARLPMTSTTGCIAAPAGGAMRLVIANATHATPPAFTDGTEIHVIAGPDHDAFAAGALALLTSAPYRILPSSDRVGTRLAGAVIPRAPAYRDASRPMVRGAIEVPRDGQPIVLGPEHPTTGGYPIIAVIASADLGRFFSIALGKAMRFIASR